MEEKDAAKVYISARRALESRQYATVSAALEGFPPVQKLPRYIIEFVANARGCFNLLVKPSRVP